MSSRLASVGAECATLRGTPAARRELARLDAPTPVKQRLDRNIRALADGELPPPRKRDPVDPRYLVHFAFFLEGSLWHAFKFWIDDQSKPGVWLFQAATYRTKPAV